MSSAKTIQDCLTEWFLQDNCNCPTEVKLSCPSCGLSFCCVIGFVRHLNCLSFLDCLVFALSYKYKALPIYMA